MELEKVKQLILEGYSIRKLQKFFKASNAKIRYFLKKNNIKTNGYVKTFGWEKEKILSALIGAQSKSDILRNLGRLTKSGNFQTLDKYCNLYNIDISKINYGNFSKSSSSFKQAISNEELFKENSKHSLSTIKKRILKDSLIEYRCKKCNNSGEWMDEKISLQLDHENGINNDHRLCNLRYLCPNCHSQTSTFCRGKNIKTKSICQCGKVKNKESKLCIECFKNQDVYDSKINISKEELEELISKKSYIEIGKIFKVSDNAVKKRALRLGIKLKVRRK